MKRRLWLALTLALLAGYAPVKAAPSALTFLYDGSDATQDLSFGVNTSGGTGTAASDTGQQYTGPRSLKLSTGASANSGVFTFAGAPVADAGRRISIRVRFGSVSPSATGTAIQLLDASLANVAQFELTTAGKLTIRPQGIAAVAGSTTLSVNTWHRVTISYAISSTTVWRFKTYIDGVLDNDLDSTGTMTRTGSSKLRLQANNNWGTNQDAWFDDIYVDDGADYTDPGAIRVTNKRPFANGSANGFGTTGSAGGYGTGNARYVNEQPLNAADNVTFLNIGASVTEEYTVEGASVGDVNVTGKTLVGSLSWAYLTATTSSSELLVHRGSTVAMSTTTAVGTTQYAGDLSSSYPAGGTDVGVVSVTNTNTMSVYEAGVLIAYTEPVGGASAVPAIINAPIRGGGRIN